MINMIVDNKEWIFSGIGVALVSWMYRTFVKKRISTPNTNANANANTNTNTNTVNINIKESKPILEDNSSSLNNVKKYKSTLEAQNNLNILFVDDDTKFKVVNILKTAGYKNTKIIKDVKSLDSHEVVEADIFFIDIQGVGKKLHFKDEGLGLANALKEKYNDKKIVIYSAETRGDRFHNGLRKADDFLTKNADPYEFQQIIETFFIQD